MDGYTIRPLDSNSWEAFARLAERHNGMGFGGCWCTWFHPRRETLDCDVEAGRPHKEFLVRAGLAHATAAAPRSPTLPRALVEIRLGRSGAGTSAGGVMANLVVHFEIHAAAPQRLIDFYSALLGWTFTKFGEMDYWAITTGEGSIQQGSAGLGINGGLVQRLGPSPQLGAPVAGANLVVGVDDVDAIFNKGIELGAVGALPPADMAGVGRLAYLLDPDGNILGFISPVLSDGTNMMAAAEAG